MEITTLSWNTNDGIKIYAKKWSVEAAKAVICLVHGYGEHINRYNHLAAYFNQKGIAVLGYDQRGHGNSEGKRGHSPSYEHLMEDVAQLLIEAETAYPNTPVFLYGHSMGGGLVLNYCIRRHPNIQGLISSAPWIRLGFDPPVIKVVLGRLLRNVLPGLQQPSGLDPRLVSSSPEVVELYKKDPLVHDRVTLAAGADFLDFGLFLDKYEGDFPVPLLLMHGDADKVTSFPASKSFSQRVQGDIAFKRWEGMYHEIHNEPGQQEVFDYTFDWLSRHIH